MPETHFSRHAYDRVIERLTMEPSDVAALLDWDLAVRVGEEKGTNRVHRLFYSHDDDQYFVCVQDERTSTIVTILPVDYYESMNWRIPISLLDEARSKVSSQASASLAPKSREDAVRLASHKLAESLDAPKVSGIPIVFRISGVYLDEQNRQKSVNLSSWPSEEYGRSVARLLQDDRFFAEMWSRFLTKKGTEVHFVGLTIGGQSSKPVLLRFE